MTNWYERNLRDCTDHFNKDLSGSASITLDSTSYSSIWVLYDMSFDKVEDHLRGYVETIEEANNWVNHSPTLRAWHQKLRCYIPGEKCSPLCGEIKIKALNELATRDTDKTE